MSRELFSVLRVQPVIGHTFTADEDRPGGPRAIILGHDLWQRRFGGDRSIVGRPLVLDGEQFTVIGVMPRGFAFPASAELWASTAVDHEFDARDARHVSVLGRLRPGTTIEAAGAELADLERRLAERFPRNYADYGVRLIPLHERIVGDVRPALLTLFGAVTFVLLIACANVANLLLARASGRQSEMAVRAALGATRARIVRQLVMGERDAVARRRCGRGCGRVWHVAGAARVRPVHDSAARRRVGRRRRARVHVRGGSGDGPRVRAHPGARRVANRHQLHAARGQPWRDRWPLPPARAGALVVAELALALVLLVGAGLLIRSLQLLTAVDPGVRVDNVLTFRVGLPPAKLDDRAYIVEFYRQLRERLGAAPGVLNVGLASRLPLSGEDHSARVRLEGESDTPGSGRRVQDRAITPGYFRSLGIALQGGREFTDADAANAPPVVIINETLADRLFPGQSAVGKRIVPNRAGNVPREIVGVVADARQFGVDVAAEPEFYFRTRRTHGRGSTSSFTPPAIRPASPARPSRSCGRWIPPSRSRRCVQWAICSRPRSRLAGST